MERHRFLATVLLCTTAFAGAWAPAAAAADNRLTFYALHIEPVTVQWPPSPPVCEDFPEDLPSCVDYTIKAPTGFFHVYLVAAYADSMQGGALGIEYCGGEYYGIIPEYVTWTRCLPGTETYAAGDRGPWPAPGSSLRFTFDTCQVTVSDPPSWEPLHAVIGAFYVYAYTADVLEITPDRNVDPPELAVVDCRGDRLNLLDLYRLGYDYHEGAAGFGGLWGLSCPIVEPPCFPACSPSVSSSPIPQRICDGPAPVQATTWGLLKSRYRGSAGMPAPGAPFPQGDQP